MRVVFAGTPAFASPALEALAGAGHHIPLVLTQPDRPAGRGMRLAASHVAATAASLGLEIAKPQSLRDESSQEAIRAARPDVMVVAAYGLILPKLVLEIPRWGCLNIHASLLPRWRGAAPVHRALLAGDAQTGVSIMQMDEGLDTGAVLLARPVPIDPRDTTGTLTGKLANLGARAIVEALAHLESLKGEPQVGSLATYAAKVAKSEAPLDWNRSAEELERQVRAFNPAPGAEGVLGAERLKVWEAEVASKVELEPGNWRHDAGKGLVVACGTGALRLLIVQRQGGRRMTAAEYLRGNAAANGLSG